MKFSGIFSAERITAIKKQLFRLGHLYVERTKLTLADRLTILLGAIITLIVCVPLIVIALVFLSGALIEIFTANFGTIAAWLMVGGIYALITLIVLIFRKPIILDPTARFVSKLIFKEDGLDDSDEHEKSGKKANP